jgi:hypothetical protein
VEVDQPELVRLRDDVGRMRRVLVVLGLSRPDLLLGELVREVAQGLLLVGQLERDPEPLLQRCHGLSGEVD